MDAMKMPGDAEADAAAAGMQEMYGRPVQTLDDCYGRAHAVGGWLTWARADWPAGRTSSGLIKGIANGRFLVEFDGDVVPVTPAEVMPL